MKTFATSGSVAFFLTPKHRVEWIPTEASERHVCDRLEVLEHCAARPREAVRADDA